MFLSKVTKRKRHRESKKVRKKVVKKEIKTKRGRKKERKKETERGDNRESEREARNHTYENRLALDSAADANNAHSHPISSLSLKPQESNHHDPTNQPVLARALIPAPDSGDMRMGGPPKKPEKTVKKPAIMYSHRPRGTLPSCE